MTPGNFPRGHVRVRQVRRTRRRRPPVRGRARCKAVGGGGGCLETRRRGTRYVDERIALTSSTAHEVRRHIVPGTRRLGTRVPGKERVHARTKPRGHVAPSMGCIAHASVGTCEGTRRVEHAGVLEPQQERVHEHGSRHGPGAHGQGFDGGFRPRSRRVGVRMEPWKVRRNGSSKERGSSTSTPQFRPVRKGRRRRRRGGGRAVL